MPSKAAKMRMKEEKKTEVKDEYIYIPIDRATAIPCNECRKRLSCLLRPRNNQCNALEEGIPWDYEAATIEY